MLICWFSKVVPQIHGCQYVSILQWSSLGYFRKLLFGDKMGNGEDMGVFCEANGDLTIKNKAAFYRFLATWEEVWFPPNKPCDMRNRKGCMCLRKDIGPSNRKRTRDTVESASFSFALPVAMVTVWSDMDYIGLYGSVSKPCTPGEHQNSW